jgi:hypothetical protein
MRPSITVARSAARFYRTAARRRGRSRQERSSTSAAAVKSAFL